MILLGIGGLAVWGRASRRVARNGAERIREDRAVIEAYLREEDSAARH
jgi:hypothetical protein